MKKIKAAFFLFLQLHVLAIAQPTPPHYTNPILSGYHPDPSVCRVGDDYYLVNSSFEFYPGMPIFHSKDLVNWKLIGYGLHRPTQVELPVGLKDSRGIYAVTLRHHEGLFYLITTCVNCKNNFYITASNPSGPWSDPIWLNSPGIDPSLFFDDDGKCYYTGHANISGKADWPDKNGVWIQELDLKQQKLVGKRVQLTHGHATNARWTEGPHLYKINGTYMLLVAEGGTGFHHAVTVFHSDSVFGPYIPEHTNPVMTHRNLGKEYPIHSVGHADLVQTQTGDWWAVMLGKRQINGKTYLGRETFLTPVKFEGQTPVFNPGIGKLQDIAKRPDLPWTPVEKTPERDHFTSTILDLNWNFLRTPYTQWYTLKDGKLTIQLRPEVVDSMVNPSMIIRRMEHHTFSASTKLSFTTKNANEAAGLIIYRASTNHYQFLKYADQIVLRKRVANKTEEIFRIPYTHKDVVLAVEAKGHELMFTYGENENSMQQMSGKQPFDVISDEKTLGFTGPFVGMYATSNGKKSKNTASFDWFEYSGK